MNRGRDINIKKFSFLKPKNIIIISVVLVVIIIVSTIYEYNSNKNEIYHLLGEYASSMLHVVSKSSENSIVSDSEMENLLAQHLLGVARNVSRLDSLKLLSDNVLVKVADENEVFRINVFSQNKERIFSNAVSDSGHQRQKGKYTPESYLTPLYEGKEKELVIGLKEARLEKGSRFAVAVRRANSDGVIVVNLDAESYLNFKNKIGFGKLILDMGKGTGIVYVALQNEKEILAANRNVNELSAVKDDAELRKLLDGGESVSRVLKFQGSDVFESVSLFRIDNEKIGIFRVGLSMEEVSSVESRMLTRTLIVSLLVIVITVIVLSLVISNQNYTFVENEFKRIQTFTGNILENLSLALITVDAESRIRIFNKAAFEMFGLPYSDITGTNISEVSSVSGTILETLIAKKQVRNYEVSQEVAGNNKSFMLNSTDVYTDDNVLDTYSLVIEDITEIRKIEKQLTQNEKFFAMGELASGVAHEIRNPLNTISMISQRLDREYGKVIKSEDFNTLTEVLHSESLRVNGIIEQFLRFAKPANLVMQRIKVSEFLDELLKIVNIQAEAKQIKIYTSIKSDEEVSIDYQQMKQVFINLFRNSIDATGEGGSVNFKYRKAGSKSVYELSDTGCGIPKENLKKIFDIYFTTKSDGTGMGLSIVRQIILQHNGNIEVESEINKGTKIIITLP
ncbi:MAG: ATP-binding protein [Ignavibacteriota bacterium]|nr:ATP-binding protein [Ignavibacteriota bacterium]